MARVAFLLRDPVNCILMTTTPRKELSQWKIYHLLFIIAPPSSERIQVSIKTLDRTASLVKRPVDEYLLGSLYMLYVQVNKEISLFNSRSTIQRTGPPKPTRLNDWVTSSEQTIWINESMLPGDPENAQVSWTWIALQWMRSGRTECQRGLVSGTGG